MNICVRECVLSEPHGGPCQITDGQLSLPDLLEALTDAAGLLDQVVEHLVIHRHAQEDSGRMVELHSIEGFTAQGWAHTRVAMTRLTEYLAVKDA